MLKDIPTAASFWSKFTKRAKDQMLISLKAGWRFTPAQILPERIPNKGASLTEENKHKLYDTLRTTFLLGCLLVLLLAQISHSSSGSLSIFLDPTNIKFTIDGPPQRYLANKGVSVAVISSSAYWVLQCQGTDLEREGSEKDKIATERLLVAVASPGQKDSPPEEDFESLKEVVVIGQGGYLGPPPQFVVNLYFALESRWEDEPGEYQGSIIFTYMIKP